jgi:hypothetical protein
MSVSPHKLERLGLPCSHPSAAEIAEIMSTRMYGVLVVCFSPTTCKDALPVRLYGLRRDVSSTGCPHNGSRHRAHGGTHTVPISSTTSTRTGILGTRTFRAPAPQNETAQCACIYPFCPTRTLAVNPQGSITCTCTGRS